jgi:hypothetical protein
MNIEEVRQKYPQYNDLSDEQLLQGLHKKYYNDMPVEQFMSKFEVDSVQTPVETPEYYGEPVVKDGQFQVGGPVTVEAEEIAGGLVEPAVSMATGALAYTPAQIGGGIQMALNPQDPMAGPSARDRIQQALTYAPRTESGKSVVAGLSDNPVTNFVAEIEEKIRLGDEALEAGWPEWLAKNAEALPEFLGAGLAGFGLRPGAPAPQANLKGQKVVYPKPKGGVKSTPSGRVEGLATNEGTIKAAIANKTGNPKAAPFKIDKAGNLTKHPYYKTASRQGWPDEVIEVAKVGALNPANKSKLLEMIHITKRAKKDVIWGASNRPTQVVGDSVMARYAFLKKTNSMFGDQINKVARESLSGKHIDHAQLFGQFSDEIAQLGGTLNDKGKLVFPPGAKLAGQTGNQKGLAQVLSQIKALGPNPDAYALHGLKQFIDEFVSYGKKPGAKTAMSGAAERSLKALRAGINEKLQGVSSNYDIVNTGFADTKTALQHLGEAFGKNLYGPGAEKATGGRMRRWIGNADSRVPIMNAFKEADDIARKYGGDFTDAAEPQILIANALDDLLTTPLTRTSFKAEGSKAVTGALESIDRSWLHHTGRAIDESVNKIMRVSDENAIKALEDLIRSTK